VVHNAAARSRSSWTSVSPEAPHPTARPCLRPRTSASRCRRRRRRPERCGSHEPGRSRGHRATHPDILLGNKSQARAAPGDHHGSTWCAVDEKVEVTRESSVVPIIGRTGRHPGQRLRRHRPAHRARRPLRQRAGRCPPRESCSPPLTEICDRWPPPARPCAFWSYSSCKPKRAMPRRFSALASRVEHKNLRTGNDRWAAVYHRRPGQRDSNRCSPYPCGCGT